MELVVVDYAMLNDLAHRDAMLQAVERAYGADGMGIIGISNVPGFVEAKNAVLPLAHALQALPVDYLEQHLTDPTSLYNAGWSHGKEKLGDKPDYAKSSFYFNPLTDVPGSAQDRAQYPTSYPINRWPTTHLPDLEPRAKHLGQLLKAVVTDLSWHIDALAAQKVPHYPPNLVYNAMVHTEKAKGRLLYYFPLAVQPPSHQESDSSDTPLAIPPPPPSEDSWIGWHNDSGFLTALAGDIYVQHATGVILDASPDPAAGLYVIDRHDRTHHVHIPPDVLAVQMGEGTQIVTGGAVVATPHCVRGRPRLPCACRRRRVGRTCCCCPRPDHTRKRCHHSDRAGRKMA